MSAKLTRCFGRVSAERLSATTAFTGPFHFAFVDVLFRSLIRALDEKPAALGLQLNDWRGKVAAGLSWSLPGLAAFYWFGLIR